MIYRRAEPSDAAALAEFGARSFVDSYQHLMAPGELDEYVAFSYTPERMAAEIADANGVTFLALDPDDKFTGRVVGKPERNDTSFIVDEAAIVEFYAR